jgi:FerB (NUC096) domain
VFLNITCDGKLLAFHRFRMMNYFHSESFDGRGEDCGKIRSVLVKPSACIHSCDHCGCFFGKLEMFMWIGSDNEVTKWLPQNATEVNASKVNFTVERFFKCNAFVHQAKIQPGADKSGLCDPRLVITTNGLNESTKVFSDMARTGSNEVTMY